VAAERISRCMDDRRTFVLHGKRTLMVNQQHMESPPVSVARTLPRPAEGST
jgi:hypothetical protein